MKVGTLDGVAHLPNIKVKAINVGKFFGRPPLDCLLQLIDGSTRQNLNREDASNTSAENRTIEKDVVGHEGFDAELSA